MVAVGRVIDKPKMSPDNQPGKDSFDAPITKPIIRQLKNAPTIAKFLSLSGGKGIGIIRATSTTPKTTPQIVPNIIRDISFLTPRRSLHLTGNAFNLQRLQINSQQPHVVFDLSHWSTLIENFQYPPRHFYDRVIAAVQKGKIPDMTIGKVNFKEGSFLPANREYPRI